MAMKVWDSCDETQKGNLTLHHIGLAAYPKRIMTYTSEQIILFTIDDYKEKTGKDFTEKDWKEYKFIIEKAMEDFITEIKAIKNEK